MNNRQMNVLKKINSEDLSHFVTYVAGLVIADAESMYDSTTYPGTVSDQLEREEALANYTNMQEMLSDFVIAFDLTVEAEDMTSPMLDRIIKEVE